MGKYSAEEVRARFETWISTQPWFIATLGLERSSNSKEYVDPLINIRWQGWQAAFAERIEVDERAVAVAKIRHFDYHGIARNGFSQEAEMLDGAPELPDGTELFTHPPAQAAQLDGWREFIEQCAETSGGEVDGNRLSRKAKELLSAAPSPGDPS